MCAENDFAVAIYRQMTPFDSDIYTCTHSDPPIPPNLCPTLWDEESKGVHIIPENTDGTCDLGVYLPMKKCVSYRLELVYQWAGYKGEECRLKLVRGTDTIAEIPYGSNAANERMDLYKIVQTTGGDETRLCINIEPEDGHLRDNCPHPIIRYLLAIPDNYVFVHDESTEKWEGPSQRLPSLKDEESGMAMGGRVAVIEGPKFKEQFFIRRTDSGEHVLAKAYPQLPEGCSIDGEDPSRGVVYKVRCDQWVSEVDRADTFLESCPVRLEVALQGGRKYYLRVPYFIDTQPWYNGEPMQMLGFSSSGNLYSRRLCLRYADGDRECWPIEPPPGDQAANIGHWERLMEHWERLRTLHADTYVIIPKKDAPVIEFCQRGYGRYMVDNIAVTDLGPQGNGGQNVTGN